ncbi:hypothetical protein [Aeromicrobium sp. 179-A 4D2 NHS]|uniref:hypothetical protein n=1 Tax=Aeromicrobium sp. 179-A 4D2 NHS TaxID=3142375 RepID=UPI0039A33FE0
MSSDPKQPDGARTEFEELVRRWFPHDHMVLIEQFRHEQTKTKYDRPRGARL